jgi:hypothetical protein
MTNTIRDDASPSSQGPAGDGVVRWDINPAKTVDGETMICNGKWAHDYGLIAVVPDAEDAELIVRAVNAHDTLVKALEGAEQWLSGWASAEPYLSEIRAALLRARASNSVMSEGEK